MDHPIDATDPGPTAGQHYQAPDRATLVFNRIVGWLTRRGVSVLGSRVLEVRGRRSGETRTTPVNLLRLDDHEYLVAPRGVTQWVRNVRADEGRAVLVLGRRRRPVVLTDLTGDPAVPVLRAYLERWKFEVGMFFDGVSADSTDAELAAVLPRHPVFTVADAGPNAATGPSAGNDRT